jgi:hypothetical protein
VLTATHILEAGQHSSMHIYQASIAVPTPSMQPASRRKVVPLHPHLLALHLHHLLHSSHPV